MPRRVRRRIGRLCVDRSTDQSILDAARDTAVFGSLSLASGPWVAINSLDLLAQWASTGALAGTVTDSIMQFGLKLEF